MGLFDRSTRDAALVSAFTETRGLNDPTIDLSTALDLLDVGHETASGVHVTPEKALKYIAVYSAVRYLSESIGSLPFPLYRREGRSRLRVDVTEDHRAFLLNDEPNPFQTAEVFWSTLVGHANLWGNAYAYVEIGADGRALGLWPLDPRNVEPYRAPTGELYYGFSTGAGPVSLTSSEVVHIRAFGTGDVGISPIGVARQAIGEALAAEEYAGRLWQNDARPGGVIQYARKLDENQHKEAVRKWSAMHQGTKRSHLVAVLDNGAEWKDVGIPAKDAEFLDSRKWGVRQIASLYRVPPHKIGDLEGNITYASIDAQNLDAVQDSLRPWVVRIEQAVKRVVFPTFLPNDARPFTELTPDGRARMYPEFLLDALLRGDVKTRAFYYGMGRQWGWLSANDIAELENRPSLGPEGDVYLQPVNMIEAGSDPTAIAAAGQAARAFLAGIGEGPAIPEE